MAKFIRIQHKESGMGVYYHEPRSKALADELWENFFTCTRHPSPSDDSLLCDNIGDICGWGDVKFGFCSKKQLRQWFYTDKVIRMMADDDFEIVEMKGTIFVGHTQAVIVPETITEAKHFEILSYLRLTPKEK